MGVVNDIDPVRQKTRRAKACFSSCKDEHWTSHSPDMSTRASGGGNRQHVFPSSDFFIRDFQHRTTFSASGIKRVNIPRIQRPGYALSSRHWKSIPRSRRGVRVLRMIIEDHKFENTAAGTRLNTPQHSPEEEFTRATDLTVTVSSTYAVGSTDSDSL